MQFPESQFEEESVIDTVIQVWAVINLIAGSVGAFLLFLYGTEGGGGENWIFMAVGGLAVAITWFVVLSGLAAIVKSLKEIRKELRKQASHEG